VKSLVLHRLALLALLLFAGSYAYGGEAYLTVCNKGSVETSVVVAIRDSLWPVINSWAVSGWTNIDPGHCENVYSESPGLPAYIGFALTDSQGRITSAGHVQQAPDFGWNGFKKALTKADKRLCVRRQGMSYKIHNDPTPALDCASFHSDGHDPGGYIPLAAALYFTPVTSTCSDSPYPDAGQPSCGGGEYYLTVRPTADDTELHASAGGTDPSAAAPASNPAPSREQSSDEPTGGSILSQLATAIQANRQKQQRELVRESIDAARSRFAAGFESFRRGPIQFKNDGEREWWLRPNPAQTEGCFFRGLANTAALSFGCDLFSSANWGVINAYYAEWLKSAMQVFPPDWSHSDDSQSNRGSPAERFVSPGGLVSLIFIERHPEIGKYVLFFNVTLPH
jgi:uncharacterized membrane protein